MQIIKSLISCLFFLVPLLAVSQTTYLLPGQKDQILLERMEIKTRMHNLSFSTIKPYSRKHTVHDIEIIDSLDKLNDQNAPYLSRVDKYNIERFLMNNSEWSKPRESYYSKKPIFNSFYKTKGNFFEVNKEHFFLAVNPLFNFQQGIESGNGRNVFVNSRGATFRGMIDNKIGFHFYLTENQERPPLYVQQYFNRYRHNRNYYPAVPGAGFYKAFKDTTAIDYLDVRGSVSWNVTKYIDMQFGYDRHFIGAGHRSLFLSDFSNNATFFKINTRIWKLNYQNLYMELIPQFSRKNQLYSRKYFRMNHLSINATKWLNVGLFDAVVFGRKDYFDFQYLLPVLFLRPAEQQIGSPDNAVLGLDAKVNVFKKFQAYGQVMFDEFLLSEIKAQRGSWVNKYG